MVANEDVDIRAARHGALADPVRLRIVDELVTSDRSPVELRRQLGIESNLLAHHLDVLEHVGMISRARSSGDGRRRYVHLRRDAFPAPFQEVELPATSALFVCTRNSARSQLAAAVWRSVTGAPGESAGTRPADQIHPAAVAAARRARLPLEACAPRRLDTVARLPPVVVTVCDQAHEELAPPSSWLHWSIADPVADGSPEAFDTALTELRARVSTLFPNL